MKVPFNTTRVNLSRGRSIAFYFLILALVLRALVPAGFMPSYQQGSTQFITLEICTPDGAFKSVEVAVNEESSSDTHANTAHEHCAFASFAQQFFAGSQAATIDLPDPDIGLVFANVQLVDIPIFSILGAPIGSRAPPLSTLL